MKDLKNLKPLEREMQNLVITHSSSIETDNMLSGDMEKYFFEHTAICQIDNDKLVVTENESDDNICFNLSDIIQVSPISHNDKLIFSQKYVCAFLYKNEQVVTFYFD